MKSTKLGKKIKQLRIDHDLKQSDLAEMFEFNNYQQVSKWEAGKLFPSIEQIKALSDKLEYNLFETVAEIYRDYKINSPAPESLLSKKEPARGQRRLAALKSKMKPSDKVVEQISAKPGSSAAAGNFGKGKK